MGSDKGVLAREARDQSAARLCVVVAPHPIVEAVRAVPPQKGAVLLLLLTIIIIMGRVRALPEVYACGSVESALSRGGADQSYAVAQTSRRWRVA